MSVIFSCVYILPNTGSHLHCQMKLKIYSLSSEFVIVRKKKSTLNKGEREMENVFINVIEYVRKI